MTRISNLPVGPHPGWELKESAGDGQHDVLRSVADSYVVLQSLRQSRDAWLSSTFPKFSTKARLKAGKLPEVVPPPHTLRSCGRCDLEIGPHIFLDTAIFEAQYHPVAGPKPSHGLSSTIGSGSFWQTTTPYGGLSYTSYGYKATTPSTSSSASVPLLGSIDSSVPITTALVSRVNNAAATDPTLANLLQLVATGRATAEQLKTLGVLIQSMASSPTQESLSSAPVPTLSSAPESQTLAGSKDATLTPSFSGTITSQAPNPYTSQYMSSGQPKSPDLILEFRETSSERWILPRGPAVCERSPTSGVVNGSCEIVITAVAPFKNDGEKLGAAVASERVENSAAAPEAPQLLVKFHFTRASPSLWDFIYQWAGGEEQIEQNKVTLAKMKVPERVYLQHRLPEGAFMTQVQNAVKEVVPMKYIKPVPQVDNTKLKRKATPRRPPPDYPALPIDDTPAPKRRRPTQTESPISRSASIIACQACGQMDVPLMKGGRYCRPCADSGKGMEISKVVEKTLQTTFLEPIVSSTESILDAARRKPVPKFVFQPAVLSQSTFMPSPSSTQPAM